MSQYLNFKLRFVVCTITLVAAFAPALSYAQVFTPIAPGFPDAMSCVYTGLTGSVPDTVVITLAAVRNGDLSPEPGTGDTTGYEYNGIAGMMAFWSDGSFDNELGQTCDATPSTATDTSVFTLYNFGYGGTQSALAFVGATTQQTQDMLNLLWPLGYGIVGILIAFILLTAFVGAFLAAVRYVTKSSKRGR